MHGPNTNLEGSDTKTNVLNRRKRTEGIGIAIGRHEDLPGLCMILPSGIAPGDDERIRFRTNPQIPLLAELLLPLWQQNFSTLLPHAPNIEVMN